MAWSPQQISNRLPIDFPDDESMRISHEAIYQALYIEGRGALERELVACLRTGRALRKPRARAKKLRTGFITDEVTIGARCGNTFRKARTSLAMIGETFRLLPMHSTTGPVKHSRGEHRQKCLPANYTQVYATVLRRQVESAPSCAVFMPVSPLVAPG